MDTNGAFRKKRIYFSQVSNEALRDSDLSLKAKGLYSLIQSYITLEDFTLYKNTLRKSCKEKEKAFEAAWKELKEKGYLVQYKLKNEKGIFYYEYELLDIKIQTPKKQGVENAGMENPPGGKRGVYNNTGSNNTDFNNTDAKNTSSSEEDVFTLYEQAKNSKISIPEKIILNGLIETHTASFVIKAIDIAVRYSKNFNLAYMERCLKSWKELGIAEVEEIDNILSKASYERNSGIKNKESTFNNFKQRSYDFKDLERKLLGWEE